MGRVESFKQPQFDAYHCLLCDQGDDMDLYVSKRRKLGMGRFFIPLSVYIFRDFSIFSPFCIVRFETNPDFKLLSKLA